MGYVIRHSTSNVNKTRRRGKVAIGNDSDGYQKTSVSGVYNGVPPVEGKHNFVRVAQGGEPNFYATTDGELINFVNGLGERNLTTTTPSQGGWAGSYSVVDSNTRTFNLTTQQNNAATTSAWRTFYWDVSDYEGQTVAISADVEFVSETNCTFSSFTIGQGNTGQYTIHIAGSDAADKVTISTKPTSSIKMAWSGSINATGIVGFTFWINNVTTNGANSVMKVSNVQIEVNDHATDFTSPNTRVSTVLEAQNHLLERNDIVFTDNIKNDNIVTDGLVLNLNSGVKSSFLDNEPTLNYTAHQTAVTQSSYTPYSATSAGTWNTKHPKAIRAYNADGGEITGYVNTGVTDWTNTYHAVWEHDNVLGKPVVVMDCADSNWKAKSFNPNTGQWAAQGWGVGTKYVISWDQWTTHLDKSVHVGLYTRNSSESQNFWDGLSGNSTTSRNTQTQTWQRVYHVYTATSNWDQTIDYQRIYMYGQYFRNGAGVKIKIANVQLEIDRDYPSSFVKPVAGESGRSTRSQNTEWKDLSGGGNNGTLTNGPVFNSKGYFEFDGTNDVVNFGDANDLDFGTNSFTVAALCYLDSADSETDYRNIISKKVGGGVQTGWTLRRQNTDKFSFFPADGSAREDATEPTASPLDRWQFVLGMVDRETNASRLYVGNQQVASNGFSSFGSVSSNADLLIGSWGGNTDYYKGNIAKAWAYNKKLSDIEINQLYYGTPIVTDGLVFAVDAGNLVSYENGSTIAYSMTGSYSGSLNNGTTYSNSNGGSFVFDGTNDFIEIDSDVTTTDGEYTLSAWLRPNGSSWGANSIPLYNTYGSKGFWHHIDENNVLRWRHDGSSYTVGDLSGVGLVADQWQLTTITWDNTTLKLYKNGILQNSTTSPSGFTRSTGKPSIGKLATRTSGALYGWNGDIALHHVYNKALTHSEVLQNYNSQKARFI